MSKIYTTKSAAKILAVKQDTVKHYALRFHIGSQPGGPGTPWIFTKDDLIAIRNKLRDLAFSRGCASPRRYESIEEFEDRDEMDLGPLYNADASPARK